MGNKWPAGGYFKLDHTNTLPVWLQAAGYHTAVVGKYLNDYDGSEIPPGWNSFQALVTPYYYGFKLNDNGVIRTFGAAPEDYQTDALAELAATAIRTRPPRRPLFGSNSKAIRDSHPGLSRPFSAPAPRHAGLFTDAPCAPCATSTFNETRAGDKPFEQPALTGEAVYGIAERWRANLRALQAVDDLVEKVVQTLAAEGMLGNAVVVFTSDNGYFHGEHRIVNAKYWPYDEALRVPLIIRGGGFPVGVAEQLVANIDLAPTIMALAGAPAGRVMDGRPLRRMAVNRTAGRQRVIVLEGSAGNAIEEGDAPSPKPGYRGVRDATAHYVRYVTPILDVCTPDGGVVEEVREELYLVARDRLQAANRAADPGYTDELTRMRGLLDALKTCAGATCSMGRP
jgi:arylsulfatase A-like enzyme